MFSKPKPKKTYARPLTELPQEILLHTFSFLSEAELLKTRKTCKLFNEIACDSTLPIIKKIENKIPELIEAEIKKQPESQQPVLNLAHRLLFNKEHTHLTIVIYSNIYPFKSIYDAYNSGTSEKLVNYSENLSVTYINPGLYHFPGYACVSNSIVLFCSDQLKNSDDELMRFKATLRNKKTNSPIVIELNGDHYKNEGFIPVILDNSDDLISLTKKIIHQLTACLNPIKKALYEIGDDKEVDAKKDNTRCTIS